MSGTWTDGFLNGQGKITWPEFSYEGELKEGVRHGYGRFEGKLSCYEGDWRDGQRHGYGKEEMSNGELYEGNFEFDNRNGIGTSYLKGTTFDRVTGEWKDNKPHGLVKTVSSNGSLSIVYQ